MLVCPARDYYPSNFKFRYSMHSVVTWQLVLSFSLKDSANLTFWDKIFDGIPQSVYKYLWLQIHFRNDRSFDPNNRDLPVDCPHPRHNFLIVSLIFHLIIMWGLVAMHLPVSWPFKDKAFFRLYIFWNHSSPTNHKRCMHATIVDSLLPWFRHRVKWGLNALP